MKMIRIPKKLIAYSLAILAGCTLIAVTLYMLAQSLLGNVIQTQLNQVGYTQATIGQVRIYWDGIVVDAINPDSHIQWHTIFIPQTAPDIAEHGIQHMIIKQWDQTIDSITDIPTQWPLPHLVDFTVENINIYLHVPEQAITLTGTLKSLQPDADHLVLVLPFDVQQNAYHLQGKLEIDLERGRMNSIDIDVDEGLYQSDAITLKRLSGWFNAQFANAHVSQVQTQFLSGSVLYNGESFADGMLQYSRDDTNSTQWTITLNRAAEDYFNTWVIKPTADGRYAIQAATQNSAKQKSAVMISAAPLRLEPLLPMVPQR